MWWLWRRRHFFTNITNIVYFLLLLCVVSFLVRDVWLPKLSLMLESTPLVPQSNGIHTNSTNQQHVTSQHSNMRVGPMGGEANISHPEKSNVIVPQTDTDFETALTVSTSNTIPTRQVVDEGLGPFPYIINEPNKCTESRLAPFLVLLITTEAKLVEARNVIRQTWANESVVPTVGIIRLFLLGKKQEEQETQQQLLLEAESNEHHDLIQQDFLDTYNNLTLKTLMGMNWVARHCPQANYVMKTDSDMFVNTNYLVHKILQPQLQSKTNYFTGRLMINASPIRDRKNKWYMPEEEYHDKRYPAFCSGTGYLFSGDLAEKIYTASLSIPRLHLEDVYVGMCLAKLHIQPRPPPNGNLFNHWRLPYSSCRYSSLVTSHGFRPSEILKYWKDLQSKKQNPCSKQVQKI